MKSYTNATCLTLQISRLPKQFRKSNYINSQFLPLSQILTFHFTLFYNTHYQPLDFSLHRLPKSLPTKKFSSVMASCPTDLSVQQRKTFNKSTLNPSKQPTLQSLQRTEKGHTCHIQSVLNFKEPLFPRRFYNLSIHTVCLINFCSVVVLIWLLLHSIHKHR